MRIDTGLRTFNFPCGREGCREKYLVIAGGATRKQAIADAARRREQYEADGTNLCSRHIHPEKIPSSDNRLIETTLVVVAGNAQSSWSRRAVPADDMEGRWTTVEHGPGYSFYPDELPEGARVTFTVRVELPDTPAAPAVPEETPR